MQSLQPRLVLAIALRRWEAAVSAAQADDGSLCYRAVQLPRVFAAWRQQAWRQAELRARGEQCLHALARRWRHRLLLAWQQWAASKAGARSKLLQASARRAACTKREALAEWCRLLQRKAAQREQWQQAEARWIVTMSRAAFCRWRRLAGAARLSAGWRVAYLLRQAFGSWRQHAKRKAAAAASWRLAVRLHYLRQLWAGLAAWQQHHRRRQHKQQRLQAMRQDCQARLLRRCLAAWRGPFLAAAHIRHAKQQLAADHRRDRLLQLSLAPWHGPFLVAARQRRSLQRTAAAFCAAQLQRKAWMGWQAWQERQVGKRQHGAAAQAALQPARLRSVLAAWRFSHAGALLAARQAAAAEAAVRRRTLTATIAAWQGHAARRQRTHTRWCAALLYCGRHQQERAFATWQEVAHTAALLRRMAEPAAGAHVGASAAAAAAAASSGDATAALLGKLRQLQSAAAEVGSQQVQWRAASIANLPCDQKASEPLAAAGSSRPAATRASAVRAEPRRAAAHMP